MIAPRSDEPTTYRITIRSVGRHHVPAADRLRGLLKAMLRGWGFKVIECFPAVEEPARRATDAEVDQWLHR